MITEPNDSTPAVKPLGETAIGFKGIIAAITSSTTSDDTESMINRLREIGFAEGLEVELIHQSPFGKDPIAIRVDAMTVALRREEANLIKVESL